MAIRKGIGAARAYTEDQLGGPCTELESNPTAQIAAGLLLQGNADRVGLLLVNQGANNVYLSFNAGVSTTNGILLAPLGGSISFNVRDDFTILTRDLYAVASGGTSAVYILEEVRQIYSPAAEGTS